jgi:hypothetical protein
MTPELGYGARDEDALAFKLGDEYSRLIQVPGFAVGVWL